MNNELMVTQMMSASTLLANQQTYNNNNQTGYDPIDAIIDWQTFADTFNSSTILVKFATYNNYPTFVLVNQANGNSYIFTQPMTMVDINSVPASSIVYKSVVDTITTGQTYNDWTQFTQLQSQNPTGTQIRLRNGYAFVQDKQRNCNIVMFNMALNDADLLVPGNTNQDYNSNGLDLGDLNP